MKLEPQSIGLGTGYQPHARFVFSTAGKYRHRSLADWTVHPVTSPQFLPQSSFQHAAADPGHCSGLLSCRIALPHLPQPRAVDRTPVRNTLEGYIESIGLDPDRPYPPRGKVDSSYWDEGCPQGNGTPCSKPGNSVGMSSARRLFSIRSGSSPNRPLSNSTEPSGST